MADRKGREKQGRTEREPFITPESFEALRDEFDRAIDRMTGYVRGVAEPWFADEQAGAKASGGSPQRFAPLADLDEDEDSYHLSVELPGMSREQVDIEVRNAALVISGEKWSDRESNQPAGSWRERRYGSFRRTIPLPDDIEDKRIKASFRDGVLNVELPKVADSKSKRRRVKIEPG